MQVKAPEESNKLTLKELGCDPAAVLKSPAPKISLARMYGTAFKIGTHKDLERAAEYTFFVGGFEGINLQDGTVITSQKLYLPSTISDQLEKVIHDAQRDDKRKSVGFVVEILAAKSDKARSGYVYECVFLWKPETVDELQRFRDFAMKSPRNTPPAAPTSKDVPNGRAAKAS